MNSGESSKQAMADEIEALKRKMDQNQRESKLELERSVSDIRNRLTKDHKEEIDKLIAKYERQLEELKNALELSNSSLKDKTAKEIEELNKRVAALQKELEETEAEWKKKYNQLLEESEKVRIFG